MIEYLSIPPNEALDARSNFETNQISVTVMVVISRSLFLHLRRASTKKCIQQHCIGINRHAELSPFLFTKSSSFSTQSESIQEASSSSGLVEEIDAKLMAKRYHEQRILYKQQVSNLRKQYALEISTQRALEEAKLAKERESIQKRKKKRQREKNLRSVENAKRDLERKAERAKEFQKELEIAQNNRNRRNELFRKARLLFLQELEEESSKWMINEKEVEEILGSWQTEQMLWSSPYVIGATPEDSSFWRYESHTLRRQRTFLSPREYILEKLEERILIDSNLNEQFWTQEKLDEIVQKKTKAKLRALVQMQGKYLLLNRQNQMLRDEYLSNNEIDARDSEGRINRNIIKPKKRIPAPSLNILANLEAQEEEGVKILMKDPTTFFVFENTTETSDKLSGTMSSALGKPISLKHEFGYRGSKNAYPLLLAYDLNEDKLTEKEKKRVAKEEERLAKLNEAMETENEGFDFENDDSGPGPEIVPDERYIRWEEEMIKKLQIEETDDDSKSISIQESSNIYEAQEMTLEQLRSIPAEERLLEEDMEWIVEKLSGTLQKAMENKARNNAIKNTTSSHKQEKQELEKGISKLHLNEEETKLLNKVNIIVSKLSESQLSALTQLDLAPMINDDNIMDEDILKEMELCVGQDSVSEEDMKTLLELEKKLHSDNDLREKML